MGGRGGGSSRTPSPLGRQEVGRVATLCVTTLSRFICPSTALAEAARQSVGPDPGVRVLGSPAGARGAASPATESSDTKTVPAGSVGA